MVFSHYWSRPGLPPPPAVGTPAEAFPSSFAAILRGELICFERVDEVPPGTDRDSILLLGTKSNVTVPLTVGGAVVGALAFGTMRHERAWPPEIVNRLVLLGQVFAGALARKRADVELAKALDENTRLRERLVEENVYLQHEVKVLHGYSHVMGESAAIRRVLEQAGQVAPTSSTVLLVGETGTGKELLATAIHEQSPRRGRAMVSVNGAAIPATLIESELFGHEKGAFTGALARHAGRFELASGSTIFLDEIGDLPLELQAKLLRVLQTRQIERLGGSRLLDVDVRVIAATNRDLEQAVVDGKFRDDLYYRLNVFPITMPPLRDRREDLPLLVRAFVDEFSAAMGKTIHSIAKEDLAALQQYDWPGNVRELRNVIERSVIVSAGPRLQVDVPRGAIGRTKSGGSSPRLADVERDHLQSVLEATGWRIRGSGGAAEQLGLKPSTLESRMTKLHLRRPPRP
jgi:transcriptional regulator with GAF, ATPase, and Fis domain